VRRGTISAAISLQIDIAGRLLSSTIKAAIRDQAAGCTSDLDLRFCTRLQDLIACHGATQISDLGHDRPLEVVRALHSRRRAVIHIPTRFSCRPDQVQRCVKASDRGAFQRSWTFRTIQDDQEINFGFDRSLTPRDVLLFSRQTIKPRQSIQSHKSHVTQEAAMISSFSAIGIYQANIRL